MAQDSRSTQVLPVGTVLFNFVQFLETPDLVILHSQMRSEGTDLFIPESQPSPLPTLRMATHEPVQLCSFMPRIVNVSIRLNPLATRALQLSDMSNEFHRKIAASSSPSKLLCVPSDMPSLFCGNRSTPGWTILAVR